MALIDVANGVADALAEIEGLRAYKPRTMPDGINELPAAVLLIGTTPYNTAFGGEYDHNLRVILLLATADTPSAYVKLYDYIADSGTKSIKAKLEEDETFGGVCDTSIVRENSGAGITYWAGIPYLSSEWTLEIYM